MALPPPRPSEVAVFKTREKISVDLGIGFPPPGTMGQSGGVALGNETGCWGVTWHFDRHEKEADSEEDLRIYQVCTCDNNSKEKLYKKQWSGPRPPPSSLCRDQALVETLDL